MYVNALGAGLLLLTCLSFGDAGADLAGERLRIPGSLFYANANDLALTLLSGMTAFLFLLFGQGIPAKIMASMGIMLSTFYALKTGSRGCLIAGIALLGMIFLVSRNKFKVAFFALPILGLAIFNLPPSTLHRLSLLLATPVTAMNESAPDQASVASEFQRQGLLEKSLDYTLAHPLLGVGPDQFAAAVFGEASQGGENVPWLGTHNTYTQVSSECGIPALIFYCVPILLCFRLNYRLYRRTRDHAVHRDIAGLSLCLLAATLVYALSTFFFHIAYSAILPELTGFSAALHFASRSILDGSSTSQPRRSGETVAEKAFPALGTPEPFGYN
jgi:O-antigen ligase